MTDSIVLSPRQRALVAAVVALVPVELAWMSTLAWRRQEHAALLVGAAGVDAALLSTLALVAVGRRGGWAWLRPQLARAVRVAAVVFAALGVLARVGGVRLPWVLTPAAVVGELVILRALGGRAAALLPAPMRAAAALERDTWAAAWRWLRRRPISVEAGRFTTHRTSRLGQLWAAIAFLSLFELPAVHVLLSARHARPLAHVVLVVLHLYGIVWLAGDWRRIAETGHRVVDGVLQLRLGLRWRGDLPLSLVEEARVLANPRRRAPEALDLVPADRPNVLVALRAPVTLTGPFGRTRRADRLRLFVDDPAAFVAALDRAR